MLHCKEGGIRSTDAVIWLRADIALIALIFYRISTVRTSALRIHSYVGYFLFCPRCQYAPLSSCTVTEARLAYHMFSFKHIAVMDSSSGAPIFLARRTESASTQRNQLQVEHHYARRRTRMRISALSSVVELSASKQIGTVYHQSHALAPPCQHVNPHCN
jgi:hypothetical protein